MFAWHQAQEEAFAHIQQLVTSTPVLKFYDINDEVTLQCDTSDCGLGGALLQSGQPVAYASRALSLTEQSYAQIEKECMAIVFACEKFDQYLNGRNQIRPQAIDFHFQETIIECTKTTPKDVTTITEIFLDS